MRITVISFSPVGGTEQAARVFAAELAAHLADAAEGTEAEIRLVPYTLPQDRQELRFGPEDVVVMASPVYAGRLPNKLMPEFKAKLSGDCTPVAALCTFGNRSSGEALRELVLLLEQNGFRPFAAAALAVEHVFSSKVGTGRPDAADLAELKQFARAAAQKLAAADFAPLGMDRREIGPYYTPLKEDGTPARFLKAKPRTDAALCDRCGRCAAVCPMGSIDPQTLETVGVCIKCQACLKACPVGAKSFDDPDFLSHVAMLEQHCTRRAPNIFLL